MEGAATSAHCMHAHRRPVRSARWGRGLILFVQGGGYRWGGPAHMVWEHDVQARVCACAVGDQSICLGIKSICLGR
jgi:hypothetical protein